MYEDSVRDGIFSGYNPCLYQGRLKYDLKMYDVHLFVKIGCKGTPFFETAKFYDYLFAYVPKF